MVTAFGVQPLNAYFKLLYKNLLITSRTLQLTHKQASTLFSSLTSSCWMKSATLPLLLLTVGLLWLMHSAYQTFSHSPYADRMTATTRAWSVGTQVWHSAQYSQVLYNFQKRWVVKLIRSSRQWRTLTVVFHNQRDENFVKLMRMNGRMIYKAICFSTFQKSCQFQKVPQAWTQVDL